MVNVSFNPVPQKIDKNGLVPIYMTLTFDNKRIRKALKNFKVHQRNWNAEKERVKSNPNDEAKIHDILNSRLESLKETVAKINKSVLRNDLQLDQDFILRSLENPSSIRLAKLNFFQAAEEYIDSIKGFRAERTITGYQTSFNFLKAFQRAKKFKITFESIDIRFFESLRNYAFEEKGIASNYFVKIISTFKAFMRWAEERVYHSNPRFKKFKVQEVENEVIYLTLEELMELFECEFESRRLNHVRDIYCFSAFTGLRFSDVISLNESHIRGEFIIKTIQKTGESNSKIPLSKYAKLILQKYDGTVWFPLPRISSQKFNKYIKECCQIAGIDSPITQVRFSGSKKTENIFPKHQLITSHTARKTFVTNSLILGMKEMVVRNITGHRKEESFRRYVKIAEDVKRTEMESTWDVYEAENY